MSKVWAFMKSPKCTEIIINILLGFVLLAVGIILFWQLYPYKILESLEGNYGLEKFEYHQGDSFNIKFRICKKIALQEDVYGRFIDGVIYSVPENSSNFEKGCYDTYITSVDIPKTLPPGTYVYEEIVIYHPNPIRIIEYKFTTPEFTVVE